MPVDDFSRGHLQDAAFKLSRGYIPSVVASNLRIMVALNHRQEIQNLLASWRNPHGQGRGRLKKELALRDFLHPASLQATFAPSSTICPQSDKNLKKICSRRLHSTAHRCRKGSIVAGILSDEIDVRPMSSAARVNPRNAVIGRFPLLSTRLDDPFSARKSP